MAVATGYFRVFAKQIEIRVSSMVKAGIVPVAGVVAIATLIAAASIVRIIF